MSFIGVMDDLELGDRADGRPMLRRVRKTEYIHESPRRRARAQVDKQPYYAWLGDIYDNAGHALADRVHLASDFEVQFGRIVVGHRSSI